MGVISTGLGQSCVTMDIFTSKSCDPMWSVNQHEICYYYKWPARRGRRRRGQKHSENPRQRAFRAWFCPPKEGRRVAHANKRGARFRRRPMDFYRGTRADQQRYSCWPTEVLLLRWMKLRGSILVWRRRKTFGVLFCPGPKHGRLSVPFKDSPFPR